MLTLKKIRQIAAAGAVWFVVSLMPAEINAGSDSRGVSPRGQSTERSEVPQSQPAPQPSAPASIEHSSPQPRSVEPSPSVPQASPELSRTVPQSGSTERQSTYQSRNIERPSVSQRYETSSRNIERPGISERYSHSAERPTISARSSREYVSQGSSYDSSAAGKATQRNSSVSRQSSYSSSPAYSGSSQRQTYTVRPKTVEVADRTNGRTQDSGSSLKTSTDVTEKISEPARTTNSRTAKIIEVDRTPDRQRPSGIETSEGSKDGPLARTSNFDRSDINSARLPDKDSLTRESSKTDLIQTKESARETLKRDSAIREASFMRDSDSNRFASERTLDKGRLSAETERRANISGTKRVTAVPSEDFKQRTLVTASETKPLTLREPDSANRVVVNGDNNVIIQGDVNVSHPRPYIAPTLYHHDLAYHHRHDWHDHGTYFSFSWSSGSCGSVIWAPYHSHFGFSYYYPDYHQKFVFVSIGGYWPTSYRYRRYYWYGCHPHYWYGTHIVEAPVVYNTYNTYNYYGTTAPQATATTTDIYDNPPLTKKTDVVDVVDAPNDEDIVDICFAHGVKVFAEGNYPEAIERFRRAVQMDPKDVILPFTYSQALFANGEYALAAGVLRGAIANIPEDELTIYYPRGLYEDEEILTNQIKLLEAAIAGEPFVADYQLLLGYQYLGIGDLQKCRGPLTEASKDSADKLTAAKLLELADRLEAERQKADSAKADESKAEVNK